MKLLLDEPPTKKSIAGRRRAPRLNLPVLQGEALTEATQCFEERTESRAEFFGGAVTFTQERVEMILHTSHGLCMYFIEICGFNLPKEERRFVCNYILLYHDLYHMIVFYIYIYKDTYAHAHMRTYVSRLHMFICLISRHSNPAARAPDGRA